MCTVTALRRDPRLIVTMNRDEANARAPELPPTLLRPEVLAPIDGQGKGTWMGASTFGVVGCLLNAYGVYVPQVKQSRGLLLPMLLSLGPLETLKEALVDLDPTSYDGFRLLLFNLHDVLEYTWDGRAVKAPVVRPLRQEIMVTSSSWKTLEVTRWREEAFQAWVSDGAPFAGEMPTYHLLQPPGLEAYAPLMARPFRSTRSITRVTLEAKSPHLTLLYWPDPGRGLEPPPHAVTLPLRGNS